MSTPRTYALVGQRSGDLLSYGGRVITHPVKAELEWLIPGTRVVEINPDTQPIMRLKDHPDLAAVTWPLRRKDFQ